MGTAAVTKWRRRWRQTSAEFRVMSQIQMAILAEWSSKWIIFWQNWWLFGGLPGWYCGDFGDGTAAAKIAKKRSLVIRQWIKSLASLIRLPHKGICFVAANGGFAAAMGAPKRSMLRCDGQQECCPYKKHKRYEEQMGYILEEHLVTLWQGWH